MTFPVVIAACLVALPFVGCATSRGPRQLDTQRSGGTPPESNWSRVGELAPASELLVSIRGAQAVSRHFLLSDDSGITLLNLTDPTLPAATRVMRGMAFRRPESFAAMQRGGTFAEDSVRFGRDGVFVADRKIADLGQIVETIARHDITEIRGPVVARGSVLGTILGGWLGFAIGAVPALGGASAAVGWPVLIGSVAGGAWLGSHWSNHETEGVVYRVP